MPGVQRSHRQKLMTPPDTAMFTFSEQILILLLEDERGTFMPIPRTSFECALAGAVLMDLAFANRIDTDLETLMVTDRTPTGNIMLDRTLAKIGAREETTDTRTWIRVLAAGDTDYIREQALVRLVQHGILERRDGSFIWAFGPRRGIPDRRERRFARPPTHGATTRPSGRSSCALATCCSPTNYPTRATSP